MSELSVLQTIWILIQVSQPRHQCQRPLSFSILALSSTTLWHILSVQHMCVSTMLGISVCDFVCDPFGSQSSHSLALLLSSVCVAAKPAFCFLALRAPCDQRATATYIYNTRSNTIAYSTLIWEVSMVASTGSALQLLSGLVDCWSDCSS